MIIDGRQYGIELLVRTGILLFLLVAFQVMMAKVSVERETKRRFQHALTGFGLVQISYFIPEKLSLILLVIAAVGIYILQKHFPSQYSQAFGGLLRSHERTHLPGAFWFLVGTFATILLIHDWVIIRYAVYCLSFADPMASFVGSKMKSRKINSDSSISGCAACFLTACLIGHAMLSNFKNILIGALACTVAEALPYGNDNLNIPVITSLAVVNLGKQDWFYYW